MSKKRILIIGVLVAVLFCVVFFSCRAVTKRSAADVTADIAAETSGEKKEDVPEEAPADESPDVPEEPAADEEPADPEPAELYGSPWITSIATGNLPDAAPDVRDDLYTHYNYDFLAEHQGEDIRYSSSCGDEIREIMLSVLEDPSHTGHDLEQMRLFHEQAADTETLKKTGFSEVQPYIDMIDEVTSIEEMNALLASDDFPFSPFLHTTVMRNGLCSETIVGTFPNTIFFDPVLYQSTYYQDYDDPAQQESAELILYTFAYAELGDAALLGISDDQLPETMEELIQFEKAYAKYSDYNGKYSAGAYGMCGDAVNNSVFTLEELCALCPNLPMKEMLDKVGRGSAPAYMDMSPDWMRVLSDMWTQENLDVIKLAAKCSLLSETRPYRDHSVYDAFLTRNGIDAPDAETLAYNACDSINTFSHLIARIYLDEALLPDAKERLTSLTRDLLGEYREMISGTDWLSEESRVLINDKLENMALNILEPQDGFTDYGGLELLTYEQGGSLFSNYLRLRQYRYDQENKMIGGPARTDLAWFMVAPTVENAFYEHQSNAIYIFPGIVKSSIYRKDMDDAELNAGIGFIIAHEISHGFDYLGSQLDARGLGHAVFSEEDQEIFLSKCGDLADYYATIEVTPGRYINGETVKVEAAADLAGMQACLRLAGKKDGLDYDRFFSAMARYWAEVMSAYSIDAQFAEAHAYPNLRINVSVQMYDTIYDVFGVREGDGMYLAPQDRIVIWGG